MTAKEIADKLLELRDTIPYATDEQVEYREALLQAWKRLMLMSIHD
jgi:hypothetical protein